MFFVLLGLLALLVLGVVVERTRELGFRAVLELGPVAGRDAPRLLAALARQAPLSAVGAVARLGVADAAGSTVENDGVELEVAVREQHRRLRRGLPALRVLGACASGLGFAGAIVAIASIHHDHGLLDLDPERIARAALGEASQLLALGFGTSAFAISSLVALQARARVAARELDRIAELCGRAPRTR